MDINEVKIEYDNLNRELKRALSRMERSDMVYRIKDSINELQRICPHDNGHYNFANDEECPYCGKKFVR